MNWIWIVFLALAAGLPADEMIQLGEKLTPSKELDLRASYPRTLILLGAGDWKQRNSQFLGRLQGDGHFLTFENLKNFELTSLFQFGVLQFENVIVADENTDISAKKIGTFVSALMNFLEQHGNLLLFQGIAKSSNSLSSQLMTKFGFKSIDSPVKDFFQNSDSNPSRILSNQLLVSDIFSQDLKDSSFIYSGRGHSLPSNNLLPFSLLQGNPTTISGTASGASISLVSAMQTRANSRILIFGSPDFCSDESITTNNPNLKFCKESAQWLSQQRGVVDWANMYHRKVDSSTARDLYRIKDDMEFQIDLFQLSEPGAKNGSTPWIPASRHSAQVEFTNLDPHWRLYLQQGRPGDKQTVQSAMAQNAATVVAQLKVPDHFGIFKFVVRLTQKGFSFLHLESLVPVRNFRHNDYPRFLWCASPYYASTFTALALLVGFSLVFIHSAPRSHSD